MIAPQLYRAVLRLLPADLQSKQSPAIERSFQRELDQAREHGSLRVVLATLRGLWDVLVRAAYERVRPSDKFDPNTPLPTSHELLRGLAASFAVSFVLFTLALVGLYARHIIPMLSARGASGTIPEVLLLAIPFNAALTIPIAVLLAVLVQFTRLGANGTLAAARATRHGVRRLVQPVLLAATGITALAFVVTAELVPRTNHRLSEVFAGTPVGRGEREMTFGQLREAARNARIVDTVSTRASMFEVEVHKKAALPAACLVFAMTGMAIAFALPRGGSVLVVLASVAVIGMYYMLLMTGETLADRHVVSPFVAMWTANAMLLCVALLATWRRRSLA